MTILDSRIVYIFAHECPLGLKCEQAQGYLLHEMVKCSYYNVPKICLYILTYVLSGSIMLEIGHITFWIGKWFANCNQTIIFTCSCICYALKHK